MTYRSSKSVYWWRTLYPFSSSDVLSFPAYACISIF